MDAYQELDAEQGSISIKTKVKRPQGSGTKTGKQVEPLQGQHHTSLLPPRGYIGQWEGVARLL